jgi:hypothetical protein
MSFKDTVVYGGTSVKDTSSEYMRGWQQGYEAGRAEASELIEALMIEKNNMLPPNHYTKMRELWEAAKNTREELMKNWRMKDNHEKHLELALENMSAEELESAETCINLHRQCLLAGIGDADDALELINSISKDV